MENQLVLVGFHVYRPVILKLESECRTPPRDMNVCGHDMNSEFVRLLNNLGPYRIRTLSVRYSERDFLVNIIVELESRKVAGAILGPGEENRNQHEQNENLPAAQA
jgi:hypothetical protein